MSPVHCVLVVKSFGSMPDFSSVTQLLLDKTEICTVPRFVQSPLGLLEEEKLMAPEAWLFLLPIFPSCLPLSALL